MTPARAKRNSKAPNRFSSDNSRIETSNDDGETNLVQADVLSTERVTTINPAMKPKQALREPLKVKLPKLKRLPVQPTKDSSIKSNPEIKIHKIKLPSLFSRKQKSVSNNNDLKTNHKKPVEEDKQGTREELEPDDSHEFTPSPRHQSPTPMVTCHTSPQIDACEPALPTDIDPSFTSSVSDGSTSSVDDVRASPSGPDCNVAPTDVVSNQPAVPPSSGIHCPCGVDDDLGVMVECESCSTWQHGHCINVGTEEDAYEGYVCAYCSLPKGEAHKSLYGLIVGDRLLPQFKSLESLMAKDGNVERDDANENNLFKVEDLYQAVADVRRVLNSIRVKWRLLTSQSYELELRIWQNPYWSDEPASFAEDEKNFYFIDRCKRNLRLNLRNMVKRVEHRSKLINYAITAAERGADPQDSNLLQIRHSFVELQNSIQEYKDKLQNLS